MFILNCLSWIVGGKEHYRLDLKQQQKPKILWFLSLSDKMNKVASRQQLDIYHRLVFHTPKISTIGIKKHLGYLTRSA